MISSLTKRLKIKHGQNKPELDGSVIKELEPFDLSSKYNIQPSWYSTPKSILLVYTDIKSKGWILEITEDGVQEEPIPFPGDSGIKEITVSTSGNGISISIETNALSHYWVLVGEKDLSWLWLSLVGVLIAAIVYAYVAWTTREETRESFTKLHETNNS